MGLGGPGPCRSRSANGSLRADFPHDPARLPKVMVRRPHPREAIRDDDGLRPPLAFATVRYSAASAAASFSASISAARLSTIDTISSIIRSLPSL